MAAILTAIPPRIVFKNTGCGLSNAQATDATPTITLTVLIAHPARAAIRTPLPQSASTGYTTKTDAIPRTMRTCLTKPLISSAAHKTYSIFDFPARSSSRSCR